MCPHLRLNVLDIGGMKPPKAAWAKGIQITLQEISTGEAKERLAQGFDLILRVVGRVEAPREQEQTEGHERGRHGESQ